MLSSLLRWSDNSFCLHEYGDPADVLRLENTDAPHPGAGQIRVAVQACGLTPADWALCGGLFAGDLPRGIGLEVAGTVDEIGDGVTGVQTGESVFGPAPFTGLTAGASEHAVLDVWFPRPPRLDPINAAALPMAVETAYRGLDELGVAAGTTVLVHGAGSTVGFAAVQIAVQHGARVIATAGETYANTLRVAGAEVTSYGDGMVELTATGPSWMTQDVRFGRSQTQISNQSGAGLSADAGGDRETSTECVLAYLLANTQLRGELVINFTEDAVQEMVQQDPASPVVMLNLLRFRPDGGEASYFAYLEHNAAVWARYGVESLYAGAGGTPLVAESGQEWDAVAVVRYPSRQAFSDMVRDPEYLANEHYRTDALTESVLQPTTPVGI